MKADVSIRDLSLADVSVEAVYACLPARSEDSLARCTDLYGDAAKAAGVVKATGILSRRIAAPGTTSLDLSTAAARALLDDLAVAPDEIGALVFVTFTPARVLPCNGCQAHARLGLPRGIPAFDINLACSGWPYGLFVAGQFARAMGRKVLLLDGDVQTDRLSPDDLATIPVLADAGTATLLTPDASAGDPWRFAFLTDGEKGDALSLPVGGSLSMDGFGVFKFVSTDVTFFLRDFLSSVSVEPAALDAFVPHQANVFMIRQMARKLGFSPEQLWVSGDVFGNSASASVPTTIAHCASPETPARLLVAGFGGGLSASAALISLSASCRYRVFDL